VLSFCTSSQLVLRQDVKSDMALHERKVEPLQLGDHLLQSRWLVAQRIRAYQENLCIGDKTTVDVVMLTMMSCDFGADVQAFIIDDIWGPHDVRGGVGASRYCLDEILREMMRLLPGKTVWHVDEAHRID